MTLRINCWSGPRNISTALMYSFRERSDTTVVDEPLYAHYLRVTDRDHPGRDQVLNAQNPNGEVVVRDVLWGEYNSDIVFFKQMAHHLVELNEDSLVGFKNILLTRDPRDMLPSLAIQLPDATLADTGLANQVHLLNSIVEHGEKPIVIDSSALLGNPESFLHSLCDRLDIKQDPSMLSWAAGPKPEDGVWAPFWYQNVHSSTGFDRGLPSRRTVPSNLVPVLDEAIGLFDRLIEFA
ncbi:MAG: sulfotransferase family protein [Actinomycetota bacterium]|nr:sulfotransferase family protein [Actinomycetota bacterium]